MNTQYDSRKVICEVCGHSAEEHASFGCMYIHTEDRFAGIKLNTFCPCKTSVFDIVNIHVNEVLQAFDIEVGIELGEIKVGRRSQ